jgi:hypothetical protein
MRAKSRSGRKPPRQRQSAPARRLREAESAPARRPNGPENRELRTGGPQDKALYVCRCGSAFQAVVSASVRCPHCGETQAW